MTHAVYVSPRLDNIGDNAFTRTYASWLFLSTVIAGCAIAKKN
jgi:hypothetical protein